MHLLKKFSFFFLLFLCTHVCQAQIFLQLETSNDPVSKRFKNGDFIEIKTYKDPNTWQRFKIDYALYEEQTIVFYQGFTAIKDIKEIRLRNQWARVLGQRLIDFSIAWVSYGIIANLAFDNPLGLPEFLIGGGTALLGFVIKKWWGHKTYKMGNTHRLRILDLSFPAPRGD